MKKIAEKRLNELREEFQRGQTLLNELDAKRASINSSLIRISGAIQVLEELLQEENANANESSRSVNGADSINGNA